MGLYEEPEKPANALEFVHQHMSADAAGTSDVEALKKENAALKAQIEEVVVSSRASRLLTSSHSQLRAQLAAAEAAPKAAA